ncbi:MAG: hypothetical protein EBY61_06105, partial [Actinobacteria bacterium]|nr:hypothetical protein [Actinomycetota bacterium]
AIATEKTAVFAGRTTAVLGPQPSGEAVDVARATAAEHGVRLIEVASTNDWRHDAEATAAAVLAELDPSAPDPVFGSPPGRYEQVNLSEIRPSRWIFDGAHNPMKLMALVGPLRSEPGPRLGIVSVGEGKDLGGCAAAIAPALDAVIVVPFGPSPGSFGPRSHRSKRDVDGGGHRLVPPPERRPTSVTSPSEPGGGNVMPDRVSWRVRRAPRPATVPSPRSG